MKFANLKISTRLGIGFAVVLSLTMAMTAIGIARLHALSQATDDMQESTIKERLAAEWYGGVIANSVRTIARVKTTVGDEDKRLEQEMTAQSKLLSALQRDLEARVKSPEGMRRLAVVADKRQQYVAIRKKVFEFKKSMNTGDEAALAAQIDSQLVLATNAYSQSVADVLDFQKDVFKQTKQTADAVYASGRTALLMLGAAAMVLGAMLAWLLSRGITRPIRYAVSVAKVVAAGDLSTHIDVVSTDETGELL